MQASVQSSVIIKLTMQEARWLKAIVQNPLSDYENESDEPKQDREMRIKFWKSLQEVD